LNNKIRIIRIFIKERGFMSYTKVKRVFKLVGIKGSGEYTNFGSEVPLQAKEILKRANEIQNRTDVEIALFEPKRNKEHLVGNYFVGLIVSNKVNEAPSGMEYIEIDKEYATTRGTISNVESLHSSLLKWIEEKGYERDPESFIIETYHPVENGEEEIEIYLPIHS
jgi:predicted transcriptional regulator YdeE